jgi:hypothetical protein
LCNSSDEKSRAYLEPLGEFPHVVQRQGTVALEDHRRRRFTQSQERAKQAPPTPTRGLPKQIQHLLPLYALCEFRPSLDQGGGSDAPQFAWLDLMQAAAVDTAFAAQLVAGHLGEKAKHIAAALPVPLRFPAFNLL